MNERIERFEQLIAWQKARALVKQIYTTCRLASFRYDRSLMNQIRRAAVSIPSNIAEGFERGGRREFHQFLSVAKGSCAELRTQLYIAIDVGYLTESRGASLLNSAEEVAKIVGGLRSAVAKQLSPKSSALSPSRVRRSSRR